MWFYLKLQVAPVVLPMQVASHVAYRAVVASILLAIFTWKVVYLSYLLAWGFSVMPSRPMQG